MIYPQIFFERDTKYLDVTFLQCFAEIKISGIPAKLKSEKNPWNVLRKQNLNKTSIFIK